MSTLMDIVEDEKVRLERLEKFYEAELLKYIKGSLSEKKINGHTYYYRSFREKNTIKTIYIGSADSDEVLDLKKKIIERRKIEGLLQRTKDNLKEARRVLRAKR